VDNQRIEILMIEDDMVDRMAFERFVKSQKLPYNPTCVSSVEQGRQILKTKSFDVVVTDYNLGDGTAFDIFDEIPKPVPVIVVTGAGHEEIAVQAMKAGAADYLIKDPYGHYLKILDITVTNAIKARAAEQALREREEQFRLTFESAKDAIFWADPESGLIIRCNRAAEALLERPREEIVGSSVISLHPPQHAAYYADRFREHVEKRGVTDQRAEVIGKSGRVIPVEISGSLTTVGGKALIQEIFRDVTDRNRMERLLRQAHKMEALGTLAGGIAHDFNNILYVIIGFAELALEDVQEDCVLHGNLTQILDAANRARDVVNQILAFSRMRDQEKRLIEIGPLIKETLKFLRASMPTTIEIQYDIAPDLGTVLFDPTYIHQILMNLSANAAHAMREKGGVLKVGAALLHIAPGSAQRLPEVPPGRYLQLNVSDTGHGMSPEVVERIFEPYYTTKKPGEGTGLGLAVVHGIVTSEGGTITVQSEPGKGATFSLFLPIRDAEPNPEEESVEPAPTGHETLLLIDDDVAVLRMCRQMLEGLGYDVTTRTCSTEALELFRVRHEDFDLVLTDMTMPYMTGAQLAWELARIRSDIPIILCTGFSDLIDKQGIPPTGIAAVIRKPIHRSQLAQTIRRVLDEGASARNR
jgi:PAS domain S-box-containing protein